jgi:glycosyltransferase involved in cell wall biosynthesis
VNSDIMFAKKKVLFLAMGYSIHAQRRIGIFIDNPQYEVAVVSTYNYRFAGAKNYLLSSAITSDSSSPADSNGNAVTYNKKSNYISSILEKMKWLISISWFGNFIKELYISIVDFKKLYKAVKEFEPDIIFLQTLIYPSYLALFLPHKHPILITFWNGDVTWWAKWTGFERFFKKQIVTRGVKAATAITVNSKEAYNACLQYGISETKVHLIRYPGVDLIKFQPSDKCEAKRKLEISANRMVFCPRGIVEYVNSDVIVESAVQVIMRFPEAVFVFISVWQGKELNSLQARVAELGLQNNFIWQESVNWEDMPNYYNAADVMVSISSNDSLPNSMLEAMACKVPIVMGDIPQIREWVQHNVNGLLVEPRNTEQLADAIITALENKNDFIKSFLDKNFQTVYEQFNSSLNSTKITRLIDNILELKGDL